MTEKLNLLGAIVAHIILVSSIITFTFRMIAPSGVGRPALYYVQVALMLVWLIILFLVDYYPKFEFRQTRWMVISFVVLFFGGTGGMVGLASLAGRGWTLSAVILFLAAGALAFIQRAMTGV